MSLRWPSRTLRAAMLVCCAAALSTAPVAADTGAPVTKLVALAAANTTDPFDDVIGTFEHDHPGVIVLAEFGGTQVLQTQAEQGAPFDVFISADKPHMDALVKEGLVEDVRLLSLGHEVIVVSSDDRSGVASLADLATKDEKLIIGTAAVPIGAYTREVLEKADRSYGPSFSSRVLSHVVSLETNVKQVLEKVALGEADAGIVYYTDVTPQYRSRVRIVPIPSAFEVEAANYIGVAVHAAHPVEAKALEDAATGPSGRAIFRRHGYDPMEGAPRHA